MKAYKALHSLLLILEEVLVDFVLSWCDLILEHDIPKHEEGKDIAESQNSPRLKKLIQSLKTLRSCQREETTEGKSLNCKDECSSLISGTWSNFLSCKTHTEMMKLLIDV